MPDKPQSPEHALFIGWVFGALMKHDLSAAPVLIGDEYSDTISLRISEMPYPMELTVSVPPPPPHWQPGDDHIDECVPQEER